VNEEKGYMKAPMGGRMRGLSKNAFYDAHCHAFALAHPSFLAFVQALKHHGLESLYSQITSPEYLVTSMFLKVGERMRNMLSVMERDVGSIFRLMEDDLAGVYAEEGDGSPLLAGDALRIGGLEFDRLVICPLIVDFEAAVAAPQEKTYYGEPSAKRLAIQVRDLLEGIRDYRLSRPKGFLEILPFLGMDTRHYSGLELQSSLETAFDGYKRGKRASRAAFSAMARYTGVENVPDLFAGIKVYPPLGFDPWPEEGVERDKVELLWSFCESRDIPVVTHCDDQGFRVATLEDALTFSSPERWEPVLRAHPALRLDFAHFGAQYSHPIGHPSENEWTDRIVRLIVDSPNVYADFSFDGTESEYFEWLESYLGKRSAALSELVRNRLFFGTDFLVSLSKVRAYSDCFRVFSELPMSDELKQRFGHDNPENFLFGG
jgi:hypothetical protein